MNIIHKIAKQEAELEKTSQLNPELKTDDVDDVTCTIGQIVMWASTALLIYGLLFGLKSAFGHDANSDSHPCEYVTCGKYERCYINERIADNGRKFSYPQCKSDERLKPDYVPRPRMGPGFEYSPSCSQLDIMQGECPPI